MPTDPCPVCGKRYVYLKGLHKHVWRAHLYPGYANRCWCGLPIFDVIDLDEHLARHGGLFVHYLACSLGVAQFGAPQ